MQESKGGLFDFTFSLTPQFNLLQLPYRLFFGNFFWNDVTNGLPNIYCGVVLVPLVLLFLCAFAAQCKAGTVLRGALIGRIARFLWRIVRSLFLGLWRIAKNLPLVWKTALVGLVIAGGEFLLYVNDFYLVRYNIFLALKIVELLTLLAVALNLRTLEKNGQRLAEGDLTTPVDTRRLFGAFRRYGQAMNRLQSGMESAVQEQMRAERMKTELITNVSHDIKTPLTSIINYVDLLGKPHTAEEEKTYVEVLSRQSQRLKKLIDDLMEMSKASTGNVQVEIARIDAVEAVTQALGEFSDKLTAAGLTPVFHQSEEAIFLLADGRLLWRAMSNVLSNAVKYALPGTRLYVDVSAAGDKAIISFKNISGAQLNISAEELMERFVRGDSSRNTEGSGLGLNIAKSLMELQKGQLQLLVDGDLFKVTLVFPRAD